MLSVLPKAHLHSQQALPPLTQSVSLQYEQAIQNHSEVSYVFM